ncbi:hypothetical protein PV413_40555, partial [Streptomyces scabiei]|uniref:hypothetical protein n=1 Tax=Streptomyces scabiei TaxID=1930 RepID=UPI0029B32247
MPLGIAVPRAAPSEPVLRGAWEGRAVGSVRRWTAGGAAATLVLSLINISEPPRLGRTSLPLFSCKKKKQEKKTKQKKII